jgi:hypothetical protein
VNGLWGVFIVSVLPAVFRGLRVPAESILTIHRMTIAIYVVY